MLFGCSALISESSEMEPHWICHPHVVDTLLLARGYRLDADQSARARGNVSATPSCAQRVTRTVTRTVCLRRSPFRFAIAAGTGACCLGPWEQKSWLGSPCTSCIAAFYDFAARAGPRIRKLQSSLLEDRRSSIDLVCDEHEIATRWQAATRRRARPKKMGAPISAPVLPPISGSQLSYCHR